MDQQSQIELQLQGLHLPPALQTVLLPFLALCHPKDPELRSLFGFTSLATQLIEQLLLLLELLASFFLLALRGCGDILNFGTFFCPNTLNLNGIALVLHVDLDNI